MISVESEKIFKLSGLANRILFLVDKKQSESIEDIENHLESKDLYNEIYKFYENRQDLDRNIEKITLKRKIGHYRGAGSNVNYQLMVVALTILFNSFVQLAGGAFQLQFGFASGIGCFIISMIMFVYIANDNIKSKSSEKDFIYYISLQVLDDIEKEMSESKNNIVTAQNEVAATIDKEASKEIESKYYDSPITEVHITNNFNFSGLFEMIVKRLLEKKKK